MQGICKSAFDGAFPAALALAADEARENLAAFVEALASAPAPADAVLRGYASAGQPYGASGEGAARWYAERAVNLTLRSYAERAERHHSNMGVVASLLSGVRGPG